jgi:DNA-binding LacI/PurR family transcriptional regulator
VPGDVAVVGCDDSAEARRAEMTTIALGEPRRWELIVQRLHALVGGADDRTPIVGHPRLVPRATT